MYIYCNTNRFIPVCDDYTPDRTYDAPHCLFGFRAYTTASDYARAIRVRLLLRAVPR